jgi:hypothetical protein
MFAIISGTISNDATKKSNQTTKFAEIFIEGARNTMVCYSNTTFKLMMARVIGINLPHPKMVNGIDMGPKRPNISIPYEENSPEYNMHIRIDHLVRAAYEFNKKRINTLFPELISFTYREIQILPYVPTGTRGSTKPTPKPALEIMVVVNKGNNIFVMPFTEFIDSKSSENPDSENQESFTEPQRNFLDNLDNRKILEFGMGLRFDGDKNNVVTYVFENITPRVDPKTKRIYQEVNLHHSRFPEGVRKYRSATNPYTEAMSDIANWGIVVHRLVKNPNGLYSYDTRSDWCKEPGFRAITKAGERNTFDARVAFTVECVMEGGKHIKVWYTGTIMLIAEINENHNVMPGETPLEIPEGEVVTLPARGSKALAAAASAQGTTVVVDEEY